MNEMHLKLQSYFNPFLKISVVVKFAYFLTLQVRRALLIIHQRDEVEYKRERRVIVRKA